MESDQLDYAKIEKAFLEKAVSKGIDPMTATPEQLSNVFENLQNQYYISTIEEIKANPLGECVVSSNNLDVVDRLLEIAKDRDMQKKDCAALAANQVGLPIRALVLFDYNTGAWIKMLNPYVTATKGEPREEIRRIINCPKSYIRANVFLECEASYDDKNGSPVTKTFTGDQAIVLQFLCNILDGNVPEVLPRDFRTIKMEGVKRGRNDICSGCGKKVKKCICVDVLPEQSVFKAVPEFPSSGELK